MLDSMNADQGAPAPGNGPADQNDIGQPMDQFVDDGAPQGDEVADQILNQFGEDPVALARAYAELNSKIGSMANELGELRVKAQIADQLLQQQGGEKEPEGDPVEALAEKLRQKAENGEDILADLVQGLREIVRHEVEPLKQQTQQVNAELVYERFVAAHPDAEQYFQEMQAIHNEMPWLLPQNAGETEFIKGLEALYTIARQRAAGKRRGAPLDGRRSPTNRRVAMGSPSARQYLNKQFNRAIQTGNLDDWKDLVKGILTQRPG